MRQASPAAHQSQAKRGWRLAGVHAANRESRWSGVPLPTSDSLSSCQWPTDAKLRRSDAASRPTMIIRQTLRSRRSDKFAQTVHRSVKEKNATRRRNGWRRSVSGRTGEGSGARSSGRISATAGARWPAHTERGALIVRGRRRSLHVQRVWGNTGDAPSTMPTVTTTRTPAAIAETVVGAGGSGTAHRLLLGLLHHPETGCDSSMERTVGCKSVPRGGAI